MRFHLKKTLTWTMSIMCFVLLVLFHFSDRPLKVPGDRTRQWAQNVDYPIDQDKRNLKTKHDLTTEAAYVRNVTAAYHVNVTQSLRLSPTVLWPDKEFFDDDRIVNQLKYKVKWLNETEPPLKKILLYTGFGGWQVKRGRQTFIDQKCNVNACELIDQRPAAKTADAVLFNASPQRPWTERPLNQIWILFMLESPYHTPGLSAFSKVFNWTATYRHDSDIVAPYEKFVRYNEDVKFLPQNKSYAAGKTKKVAWFVSNCGARNTRREYAKELQKYISVDIYGHCGSMQCPRKNKKCFEMLNTDYKFYLSFENSNCRDYITEKFFVTGLQHDVIPIVMGGAPEDYTRAAPPHSFIHVDDFQSPEQLAQYLHKLDQNDDLYNEYFRWKGTGTFINTYFWCRVCAMLHETSRESHAYRDLEKWWRGEGVCIGKDNWRQRQRTSKQIIEDYLV
ncbi:glycoprotein 3-alpha-L-fucosyltransferase A-like [Mercenaria mercenaria]|uniref:glycoprotein 3-alpha-L-fucosyltransferase A-like n=1 Tax=Mercenaria mercenaria TaxID=6596 RepID=UPI00234F5DA4|nr:glycoprotein 3-alpha-L-fucosyltransferase A-like [Mercenaria mercenaria]XP_053384053.1 glycoprotein 3-alpha-L-fucosyltransferase A-like [Mercenaria mercenaria]XP_053384054.1 glycoprotein 3-alpha-L-fucosyltransferase A-like [Mercenaria mercenaria]XP_053384055.1 glycoprotein 3-alpha-L-fucosyltransferase A-like [Mercenaria mercenaria]XP_053384056.1 glycoprotein 3-alpha-L-fucosyltransferase A-like [Mercenaria mercenaria]XP_053384058.1 glycoprotein 3-alpha-L-fucosyltransferase A-like [Mercenaria